MIDRVEGLLQVNKNFCAFNVCSCYVNNHFKQRDGSKCNPEELSFS